MTATTSKAAASGLAPRGLTAFLRRNAYTIAGFIISGWCLWYIATAFDLADVARRLAAADRLLVGICFASVPLSMALKAVRWRLLFPDRLSPSLQPLLSSLYIGYMLNSLLPMRVGEVVRAFLAGRQPGLSTSSVLATIVVEKLLDLATLAIILVALLLVTPLPDWVVPIAYTSAAALVVGLLALAIMVAVHRRVLRLVELCEQRLPILGRLRLSELAGSFLEGLSILASGRRLAPILFWSAAVWASATFTLWAGLTAVGAPGGLVVVLLVLVVTNIGMAVPAAPGYLGVYHWLVVISLGAFGVDESQAVAAAIVLHALIFGNFLLLGPVFLWRGGLSIRELQRAAAH